MNKIYIWDNLINLDFIEDKSIHISYLDPPYNTWNTFWYEDKIEKEKWITNIDVRIKKLKKKLKKNGIVIFSISEESLFNSYNILKNNFKFVFEPIIWQTKNPLNQNKVSNISSIIHEYILIASDEKIKSIPEKITDNKIIEEKVKNYPLSIILNKDINKFPYEIIEWKKIYKINDYNIIKDNWTSSYKWHKFQKRTYQKWHWSERYIKQVQKISNYNENTLYLIDWVKDKQNLNWKFILWNSYFQSISSEIYLKMPSLLWFYQWWIQWFQTAKPIELIKRLFNNFNIWKDIKLNIIDLYTWSGNVIKAWNELWHNMFGFEIWWIDNQSYNKMKENLQNIKIEYIER